MAGNVKDGAHCVVVGGTHAGKSGTVRDVKTSKTGHVTITVVQASGVCFKTLARNVAVQASRAAKPPAKRKPAAAAKKTRTTPSRV